MECSNSVASQGTLLMDSMLHHLRNSFRGPILVKPKQVKVGYLGCHPMQ